MRALTTNVDPISTASMEADPLNDERLAWLALSLTPGLGPRRILRAIRDVNTAEEILRLPLVGFYQHFLKRRRMNIGNA